MSSDQATLTQKCEATSNDDPNAVADAGSSLPQTKEGRNVLKCVDLVAQSLYNVGVRYMFGVVGVPITSLATSAQQAGIRYVGFRNEQAAGYGASCIGYLASSPTSSCPGCLLTVGGPGFVHALAGVEHARMNGWPLILLSGSAHRTDGNAGRGMFQELDQVHLAKAAGVKGAWRIETIADIPRIVATAVVACMGDPVPGPVYIDIPVDVLVQSVPEGGITHRHVMELNDAFRLPGLCPDAGANVFGRILLPDDDTTQEQGGVLPSPLRQLSPVAGTSATTFHIKQALHLLTVAKSPLLIIGKGAIFSGAELELEQFVDVTQIPFLCTPQAKGTISDEHPLCVGSARSTALRKCDVAFIVGARLNWILHYGRPAKWGEATKFILLDVSQREVAQRCAEFPGRVLPLVGDARATVQQLFHHPSLNDITCSFESEWWKELQTKREVNRQRLESKIHSTIQQCSRQNNSDQPTKLNYLAAFGIIRKHLQIYISENPTRPHPIIVNEGANTMDVGRLVLPCLKSKTRLDAGTHGTMGVGLGYAVAAGLFVRREEKDDDNEEGGLVLAIEGDSALGFSLAELETVARWKLPVVVIVFNNGGVYGGDRRDLKDESSSRAKSLAHIDPAPTAFGPDVEHDKIMAAVGGTGYKVHTTEDLEEAMVSAMKTREPALIDLIIDEMAGTESGALASHNV